MTPCPQNGIDPQHLFAAFVATIRAQVLTEQQRRPQSPTTNRLFTPKQAGEYLGRTESAVRQMIFKKQIRVVRIGRNVRLDRRDLDMLIDENRM
jgi:excisionase family DNA binding protein